MDGVVIHRIVADDNDDGKDRSTATANNDSFLKLIQRVYDDDNDDNKTSSDSLNSTVPAPVTPPTSAIKMNSCNEPKEVLDLKEQLRPSNSPDTVISSIVNLTDTPPSTTSTVTSTTTTPVMIPIAEMVSSVSPPSSSLPPNNKENVVVAHGNIPVSKQQYLSPFGSSTTTAPQSRQRKPPLHHHHGKPPSGRPHRRLQSLPAVTNLASIVVTEKEETPSSKPLSMADIASAAMILEEEEEENDEAGKEQASAQPQRRFFNRNTSISATTDAANSNATSNTGAATTGSNSTAGSDATPNLQSQQQPQPKQTSCGIRPKRSHRRTNSLPVVLEMEDTATAQEEATTTPTTPTKPTSFKPQASSPTLEDEQQLNDIAAFAAAALGEGGLVGTDLLSTTTRSSVYVVATPSTAVASSIGSNNTIADEASVLSPTVVEKKKPPPLSHQRPPSGAHAHRRYFSTMSANTGSGLSSTQRSSNGHPSRGGIPKVYNAPPSSDGSEGELPSDDMLQALMGGGGGGSSLGGSRGGENVAASSQQEQQHVRRHSRDIPQQQHHARHASLPALLNNKNRHQRVRSSSGSNSSNGSSSSSNRSSMMMSPERFERRERERQQLLQQQKQQAMGVPPVPNHHKRCHSNSPAANHAFQSILRNREALKCNSQLIQTIEQFGGNEYHIDVAKLLNQMGWILFTSGNFKDASYFYKRSLKTVHHLQTHSIALSDDDYYQLQKLEASISTNLGTTQWRLHEFNEALGNFTRSYQIHKATYDHSTAVTTTSDTNPHLKALGDACYNVSCAYVFCKDYNSAIDKLKESYKYQTCLSNKQVNMDIARTLSMLGTVYGHKCAWDQSLKYHQKALQVKHDVMKLERQQSSNTPDYAPSTVLSSMKDVAKTLEQLGRHKEALGYYQQLLEEERRKRLFYMVHHHSQDQPPYQLSKDECIQQGQLWTTVGNLQFLLKYPLEVCYKSLQEARLLYTKAGLFTTTSATTNHPCIVQWMESLERLQQQRQ